MRHFPHCNPDQQDLLDAVASVMFAEQRLNKLPWRADWRKLMRSYALRL
ncbi:hypothetical protein [Nocardia sp. R7R-8]